MNLPTWITLIRIFLVPVFMSLVLEQVRFGVVWAVAVFIAAALTDGLDGYVARARKETTVFGQLMDPIADKLLVSAALITLVEQEMISAWLAVIIIGREFAVSGLRMVVATRGVVIPAGRWGKLKTVSQIVSIVAVLIGLPYAVAMLWIAAGITLVSGIHYFLGAQEYLR
ncbi:MAG TPA: CDP-diacylglycerol--glycerol-3-phosphate 3-phosphatidyltransferase [Limnochordia bacterium]